MSCTLLTGIQTCALPIFVRNDIAPHPGDDVGAALSQAYVPLLCFAVILIKTNGRIFSDGLCRVHSVVPPRPAAPPPTWASLNSASRVRQDPADFQIGRAAGGGRVCHAG